MPSQLWTERYFPGNLTEFIGNTDIVEKIVAWANEWKKGKKGKPLLLYGPTGTGKTALAYLIARINNWDIFELNASDFRTKEIIERIVSGAALNASFSGQLRLILLDEIDGLQARDKGGAGAVLAVLKEAQNPVILTANDIYSNRKLAPIKAYCQQLQFKRVNYLSIAKRLKEILELEKVSFDPEAITLLSKNCSGDIRSALIDLQTLSMKGRIEMKDIESLSYREREEDVFKILRKIFTAKEFSEARNPRFSSEISDELLERWIEENIPRHFTEPNDTANAFERLSKADIFNGRIMRRQHYGFLRYSSDLMTVGVSLSKSKDYPGFIMYQFPKLLSSLSKSSGIRATKKGLAEKLSEKIHSSTHEIIGEDLPFIKILFRNKNEAVEFSAQFDLSEEEIAFLLGTKPETKKVKELYEKAQEKKNKIISGKRRAFSGITEFELKRIEETKKIEGEAEESAEEKKETIEEEKQTSLKGFPGK
ncbi:MAG: replication factor C large subunit [Candidatus Diapherotrites archaeon]